MPRSSSPPQRKVSFATRQKRLIAVVGELHQQICSEFSALADDDETLLQALTCTLPVLAGGSTAPSQSTSILDGAMLRPTDSDAWTLHALDVLRQVTTRGLSDSLRSQVQLVSDAAAEDSQRWNLYELLLHATSAKSRRASGTFYTPPAIARFLVATVDRKLREQLNDSQGLADPALTILEPACGSGEFIAAILEYVLIASSISSAPIRLPQLIAIDVSPVALFVTRLRIAWLLQSFDPAVCSKLPLPQLVVGNSLAGPDTVAALAQPINVVIGNPPFSYLSQNQQPWIQSLIRGDEPHAGYFEINGQLLGEKKTWLHDDYVKFLRLAQWCIEQNGRGVVSLVTNHGWLDNATFRIARQQLLRTFDQIEVVDLHGNAKRHEASPNGERDENVFGIAQGIALVTMTKGERRGVSPPCSTFSQVSRSDLWGSRTTKLQQLSQVAEGNSLTHQRIIPAAPWFTFSKQAAESPREYSSSLLLTELMPVNSTVPVTARDHFVVARTRGELQQRIERFCDPRISDDEIRTQYFQRTRSQRYAAGDTRGWKLSEARRIVRESGDPQPFIRRCLYRPFVWRYVFWHPAMIDWPRPEFTRHLQPGNLAIIARRQSIAGREANFFWITDCLPLDGVIRSDNRGSESFFPLCISTSDTVESEPNFAAEQLQHSKPEELLAYCYALFHSPTYRTRYAAGLAMEFPRVLWPRERALFDSMSLTGKRLIEIHLLDPLQSSNFKSEISDFKFQIDDSQSAICNLQSAIESFHVGTYNVCRKWLQMEQQSRESPAFLHLQQLIVKTILLQQQIDDRIEHAGGFPVAFETHCLRQPTSAQLRCIQQ